MSVFTTTRFVCGHHNFTTNHTGRPPCHDLCRWMEVSFACARCADDYEEARRLRVVKEWRKRARRLRETVMDWMESVDEKAWQPPIPVSPTPTDVRMGVIAGGSRGCNHEGMGDMMMGGERNRQHIR